MARLEPRAARGLMRLMNHTVTGISCVGTGSVGSNGIDPLFLEPGGADAGKFCLVKLTSSRAWLTWLSRRCV